MQVVSDQLTANECFLKKQATNEWLVFKQRVKFLVGLFINGSEKLSGKVAQMLIFNLIIP